MRRAGRAPVRLLLALLVLPVPAAPADEAELEALREAIAESRERVGAYEREERGLFEAVRAVDAAIGALRAEVARAAEAAEAAAGRLARLEAESADLEARRERTRAALARRVVALYRAGVVGPVRLVFAEGSLRERLERIRALDRLADGDAELLARLAAEEEALAAARLAAAEAARERERTREALIGRRADLERERAAKAGLLARVRRDRARERALLVELETAARALEQTLAEMRRVRPEAPAAGLAGREGRLPRPVDGSVLRAFGRVVDAEFRTEVFRKGVDLAVEPGEPVRAVAEGQVRFAGWLGGYGKLVIVDHGADYFSVSGHLDEIAVAVGDRVVAGQTLGRAGETGSLSGPRLYFEIRRGAEALDPADWLRRGANG